MLGILIVPVDIFCIYYGRNQFSKVSIMELLRVALLKNGYQHEFKTLYGEGSSFDVILYFREQS